MPKYDALYSRLQHSKGELEFAFSDIEEILGFRLPASARQHAAWWSNSGGTHVQSAAWQAAGYRTQNIDLTQQTVKFVPEQRGFSEMKQPIIQPDTKPSQPVEPGRHPAFGALKGMITIPPGVDLTEPSYADWKTLYGEDK